MQLSDDSDIEGHPNVDKKSLIRFVLLSHRGIGAPLTSETLGGSNATSTKSARYAISASPS